MSDQHPHDQHPPGQLPADEYVEAAASIVDAMSYPLRLRIVVHLLEREATGEEIGRWVGASHATVARHLRVLRVAGLLRRRRAGNYVLYGTTPSAAALVRTVIAFASTVRRRPPPAP